MEYPNPNAKSETGPFERSEAKKIIARRGLVGLANDTKWNELLDAMRTRKAWRPAFRTQTVEGCVSGWDSEWFHHLPYPLISVEWMDLTCQERIHVHRLPSREEIIDHSQEIELLLRRIGFDFERGLRTIRIFGYFPRNRDLFGESYDPPSLNR